MYQVEDKPETIHLYVVRDEPARPSIAPIVLSLFTLSLLIILSTITPYRQPVTRTAIRVPAVPLFARTFSAPIQVIPTGSTTYPATEARGVLSIRNGSVIGQTLPAGFVLSSSGVQVATDAAVYVPGADATSDGMATVAAHGVVAGVNVPAFAIHALIGTSLFIRNLRAFTGGHAGYAVKFATRRDKVRAIEQARSLVASQVVGLHYPCRESITTLLTWRCQFVTYSLPSFIHILRIQLQGNEVLVAAWFNAHPRRIWVK